MVKGRRRRHRRAKKWRSIDISDVTDGSMQRTEELLVSGNIHTIPSEQLFEISRKKPKGSLPLNPDVKKQRAHSKILHVDSSVLPNPHTKPTGSSTRSMSRKALGRRRKLAGNYKSSQKAKSQLGSRLDRMDAKLDVFDIWQGAQEKPSEGENGLPTELIRPLSFLSRSRAQYRPSARPAVEPADLRSTSYIPTAEQQMKNEETLAKFEERLNRCKVQIEDRVCEETDEQHLQSGPEDAEKEGATPDDHRYEKNKILSAILSDGKAPKVHKRHVYRKSKKVRDLERKLKLRELRIRRRERRKRFEEEFEKLDYYQKMADEELERSKDRLRRRKKILLAEMYKIRKFGKDAYEPPKSRVVCVDRPSTSLRCIRADKFRIRDRFDSFRRRNLIG